MRVIFNRTSVGEEVELEIPRFKLFPKFKKKQSGKVMSINSTKIKIQLKSKKIIECTDHDIVYRSLEVGESIEWKELLSYLKPGELLTFSLRNKVIFLINIDYIDDNTLYCKRLYIPNIGIEEFTKSKIFPITNGMIDTIRYSTKEEIERVDKISNLLGIIKLFKKIYED